MESKIEKGWLMLGDRNTKYFHSLASRRRKMNQIKALRLEVREWSYDEDQIKRVVVEFFMRLYNDDGINVGCCRFKTSFRLLIQSSQR